MQFRMKSWAKQISKYKKKRTFFFLREKCKISGYKNVAKPCNQAVDIFLKKVNYKFYVVICELHSKVEQKYNFCKEKSKPELLMSYFFREKKVGNIHDHRCILIVQIVYDDT